ncbi:GAF domain-containing protein [Chloroflexota bacterium]
MRFLASLTLGKKILFIAAVGLVLEVGIFSFLGLRAVNQSTESMLEDRMTTTRLVAQYLDEALNNALNELYEVVNNSDNLDDYELLESHASDLENAYERLGLNIYSLYLIDSDGRVLWRKSKYDNNTSFQIMSPVLLQFIQGSQNGISGLISIPGTNVPVILIDSSNTNLPGEKGRILVVVVDLEKSGIAGFVQPIRLGETGYVEIVDANGIVVARTEPGPKLSPFEKSDHSGRFASLIEAGEPTRGLCHTCHEPVLRVEARDVLAFVPLTTAKWGVVIRQSEEEALKPIRDLRSNLLIFAVGLSAIILLVIAVTTRDVVGRIAMLTRASQRIAGGDLSSQIAISQNDEISILAKTFEDMRIKLHESYNQLEQRTKHLASLLSISEVLSHLRDLSNLDTTLGSALDQILVMVKADCGSIILFDKGKKRLLRRVSRGLLNDNADALNCSLGEDVIGDIAKLGKSVVSANIFDDIAFESSKFRDIKRLRAFMGIPIMTKESSFGVLVVCSCDEGVFSVEDLQLLQGAAGQVAVAVENSLLHQEVHDKEEIRGALLRDIFSIQEEERHRIARELHDETSQVVASITANIEAGLGTIPENSKKSRDLLQKARTLSSSILEEIHRIIYELRPTLLDDLGLVAAVRWLVENHLESLGVITQFQATGEIRRVGPEMEIMLFRVIQETLYNIAKHAAAKNVKITLSFHKSEISVHIKDDGKGFNVDSVSSSPENTRGLGLLGMKERIDIISGSISINSKPGGGGTEVIIRIPLE